MADTLTLPARPVRRPANAALPAFRVERLLPAAAFALLCLWSRSSPAAMERQLSPDVLPL